MNIETRMMNKELVIAKKDSSANNPPHQGSSEITNQKSPVEWNNDIQPKTGFDMSFICR